MSFNTAHLVLSAAILSTTSSAAQAQSDIPKPARKALDYVRDRTASSKSWAKWTEAVFAGFAFMAQGSTPTEGDYAEPLKKCIDACVDARGGGGQENWQFALVGLFLAEVHKRWPSDEYAVALEKIHEQLKTSQEATGGWSHKKGFSYPIKGGVPDLGIVTGLAIAALGDMKAAGVKVDSNVLSRALTYCQRASDGTGVIYGTNNPVPDRGLTRAAGAFIGLHFMNNRNSLYAKYAGGLRERVGQLETGHAFPPIHFFNSAVGNYLAGQFSTFKAKWVNHLVSMQEADGGIWMKNNENIDYERTQLKSNVIGTAVFAMILLLDRDNVFKKPKGSKARDGKAGGGSPFGRKNPLGKKEAEETKPADK